MAICSEPLAHDGRIAPCLWQPLYVSCALLLSAGAVAYRVWLSSRTGGLPSTNDDNDAGALGEQVPAECTRLMHRQRRWVLLAVAVMALVCIVQLVAASVGDNSSQFLLVVCNGLLAVAWLLSVFAIRTGTDKEQLDASAVWRIQLTMFTLWTVSIIFDLTAVAFAASVHVSPVDEDQCWSDVVLYTQWSVMIFRVMCSGFLLYLAMCAFNMLNRDYVALEQSTEPGKKSAFADFFLKMKQLMPFMWPKKEPKLQACAIISILLLIFGRVINLLVPVQYKILIDSLTPSDSNSRVAVFPLQQLLLFALYNLLQGGSGLNSTLQTTFWIPVEQYTTRRISLDMFAHLHAMSLRWHLNRKTGEVLRVMDRGTTAISSLLSYIWFNIAPVLVDIAVAIVYFCVQFDIYFGIVVFVTMAMYLTCTILITEWRTKYRRMMIDLENATNTKAVDSLLNFETVKYYGNERFEWTNYGDKVRKYQVADWYSQLSLKALNSSQNIIITLGMLAGSLLCIKRIMNGDLQVGDFVLFIAYLNQLYQPLNWFGTYYRMLNKNFIDMEKLLAMFKEEAEVQDAPGATELVVTKGHVVFDNVSFTYDPKKTEVPTLHNISFEIPHGKTVALVGPSGGGKSTILRLLFRFYDISAGKITIDGQDIRYVTQESLRRSIGVVPQDTVLFNESIGYNIRYGNVTANDDAVRRAASQAQIGDKIMTFPEQYDTAVGERGLRLSGGEKQRVAIARTLIKDPAIILLDEATSALDINTERQIQRELNRMTTGRTTLVVAHRLSTVVTADEIIVVDGGRIMERGSHEILLTKPDGIYAQMWRKQSEKSSDDVDEAAQTSIHHQQQ